MADKVVEWVAADTVAVDDKAVGIVVVGMVGVVDNYSQGDSLPYWKTFSDENLFQNYNINLLVLAL